MLMRVVVLAERASYRAPSFASKLARTRSVLIDELVKQESQFK